MMKALITAATLAVFAMPALAADNAAVTKDKTDSAVMVNKNKADTKAAVTKDKTDSSVAITKNKVDTKAAIKKDSKDSK